MNAEKLLVEAAKERWKTEIEKAINKVKLGMIPKKPRTKLDEWWRRRYYIETARLRKSRLCKPRRNKTKQKPRGTRRNGRVDLFSKQEVNQNEKMQTLWKVEDAGRN